MASPGRSLQLTQPVRGSDSRLESRMKKFRIFISTLSPVWNVFHDNSNVCHSFNSQWNSYVLSAFVASVLRLNVFLQLAALVASRSLAGFNNTSDICKCALHEESFRISSLFLIFFHLKMICLLFVMLLFGIYRTWCLSFFDLWFGVWHLCG